MAKKIAFAKGLYVMSFASECENNVTNLVIEKKVPGYHLVEIKKGILGTPSKISEEYFEFMDAVSQGNPLMQLIELSDMLGAIDAFAKNYGMTVETLLLMTKATQRAFESGARK